MQLVFTLDPRKEAQATCSQVVILAKDLQKEVVCLRNLLGEVRADACTHIHTCIHAVCIDQ